MWLLSTLTPSIAGAKVPGQAALGWALLGALDGSASRGFEMSESETSETAMPGSPPFKSELAR